MAISVCDLIRWLKTLDYYDEVYIDENGLAMKSIDDLEAEIEIGGKPDTGE